MFGYIGFKESSNLIILAHSGKTEYMVYYPNGSCFCYNNLKFFENDDQSTHFKALIKHAIDPVCKMDHPIWQQNNSSVVQGNLGLSSRFSIAYKGTIKYERSILTQYLGNAISNSDPESLIISLIEHLIDSGASTQTVVKDLFYLLKGSYTLILMDRQTPNMIYAINNTSKLYIALESDFHIVSSNVKFLDKYSKQFLEIKNEEFAVIQANNVKIYSIFETKEIKRNPSSHAHESVSINKVAHRYYLAGVKAYKSSRFDLAAKHLKKAISMDPNNSNYQDFYKKLLQRYQTYSQDYYKSSVYAQLHNKDHSCQQCCDFCATCDDFLDCYHDCRICFRDTTECCTCFNDCNTICPLSHQNIKKLTNFLKCFRK
ncbi:MAG: hypothetical protein ATN31_07210 [Candidatus Epulonipiscioides saccharophilum]|nr:MAG: hypothetical protein ATN31_07210 [Epulopiscium sp. AS2M-Bin001]